MSAIPNDGAPKRDQKPSSNGVNSSRDKTSSRAKNSVRANTNTSQKRGSKDVSRAPSSTRNEAQSKAKTPNKMSQFRTDARQVALRALVQLESSELPLSALLEAQKPNDTTRSFARELATGTTRHRARLDWTIAPFLQKPLAKLDAPVRAALRLAAYERVVLQTPHAVIADEYAGLMRGEKLKSAVAFVNAVARKLPANWRVSPDIESDAAHFLAIEFSHPQWIVERWIARFGFEKTRALCQANNEIAPLSLRVNTMKTTRFRVLESLQSRGLEAFAGELSPDAILIENAGSPELWPQWKAGEIIAQDEAAQLVALITNPQQEDFVVDLASAPGGKTTHLAQLMQNRGRVLACDKSEGRLKLVRENASRLGLSCVETRTLNLLESSTRLPDLPLCDVLLLDAPCLGTGTLRRRPDAKWRKTPAMLRELVALQRELLDAAALLVCVGGVLVYSTCSLENEENEEQIAAFLARHANWQNDANGAHSAVFGLRASDNFWRTSPSQFVRDETFGGVEIAPAGALFKQKSRPDGMFAARLKRLT